MSQGENRLDPRRAFYVVDQFERELCEYTGAPYCVAVDSCTNALLLTLIWERQRIERELLKELGQEFGVPVIRPKLQVPARTYVGVYHAARNACWQVEWTREEWQPLGFYALAPTRVVDAARRFHRGMWSLFAEDAIACLSFHSSKVLPLGRGGAILHSDLALDRWLRAARADGRHEDGSGIQSVGYHVFMPPPTAALGLWTLARFPDAPEQREVYVDPELDVLAEQGHLG